MSANAKALFALQAVMPGIGQRFFCGYVRTRYYKKGSVTTDTPTYIRPCRVMRLHPDADKAFSYMNYKEAKERAQEYADTHRMPFAVFSFVTNQAGELIRPRPYGSEAAKYGA